MTDDGFGYAEGLELLAEDIAACSPDEAVRLLDEVRRYRDLRRDEASWDAVRVALGQRAIGLDAEGALTVLRERARELLAEGDRWRETLVRGTGAQFWSYHLAASSPEECERLLPQLEQAYRHDAKTMELVRNLVARKRAGALWGPAADALRRRGEQLEARAYRRPRDLATSVLALIPGGRRWRPMHYRRPR
jgi:hypothetical protein